MEVKPGYKQTEVGVIPEEWDSEPCSRLCVKIQDGTHFSPTIRGNDYLYLTSKNVRFGYLDVSTADRIDAVQHETIYKRCDVKHGDLLLTKDGANTGNAALNTLTEQFSLLSSVALLRFDPKQHSAAYFLQQCLSAEGQQRMKDAMSGNAITRLTLEKIRKLRFPVAPLPEQRAIAEALSDVDGLLSGLDRLIAKKRDLKQAAMQQLLTGQTRLPGFGFRNATWHRSAFGEFPGDWELLPLSRISAFITKGSTPTTYGFDWVRSGVLFLRSECVSERGLDLSESMFVSPKAHQLLRRSEVKSGDILMTITGNVGRVVHLDDEFPPSNINQHIARIRITDGRVASPFVFHFLSQPLVRKYYNQITTGQAYPQISLTQVRDTVLPMPSFPEQTAIAEVLTEMDAELAALEQRREKTRVLKQAMMQELLTGRTRLA